MKKLKLKVGAVAFITGGALLMALPFMAAWRQCVSDGGRWELGWGNCTVTVTDHDDGTKTAQGSGGPCGSLSWEKGDYCKEPNDPAITYVTCEKDPDIPATQVYRSEGICHYQIVSGEGGSSFAPYCSINISYPSSETKMKGACTETQHAPPDL